MARLAEFLKQNNRVSDQLESSRETSAGWQDAPRLHEPPKRSPRPNAMAFPQRHSHNPSAAHASGQGANEAGRSAVSGSPETGEA
jgi:hypothetical protein